MSKKQDNSGIPKKSSTQKWADAVTINDNSKQRSIELRFNAEPSPKLQPKLRAMGFRHSKSQVMWYGENTQQAMDFARQVESTLPTSQEGPDLFISPTFDAVKTNIEKKEFSYVMITLKDGQTKSYIVFEPSKPKAEVIAGNFAKEKFGNEFLALAAKPRLHTKEARVLFDEGKIIFPQGQKVPTHKESSIKGLREESTVQTTDEVAETISENPQEVKQTVQAKPNGDFKRLHTPYEEREIIEQFLAQGFQRPFSAQDAFEQQYPVVDVAFRYDTPTEYFTENIEEPNMKKVQKLNKELKELKGKGTNEKREKLKAKIDELTAQVNKAEQLINDEADIFHDDLFQIILDKAKEKDHRPEGEDEINRFREYVMNNILDNRAIENYHRQPIKELVDELIDEYFSKDEKLTGTERPSAGTEKADVTDLKAGDLLVPNVLVPSATTEPFYSQRFDMYDMKEVIKNNFPHLLKINDGNLESASPIALFELIQFGHPNEYGIDVSRSELIKEFEKRGKSIFQAIGFPTDEIYPYVNLHTGYESVEPLNEMLFDNNKEGDEWWTIAEHCRPVADAKKGMKIIDQLIQKEKQEMKTYVNPKTGKPKLESKHLVRDIELTIESFEDSKAVLQHYLDNPQEQAIEDSEEVITDPLTTEKQLQASVEIIKGLEAAYWTKEDEVYPQNKVTINGMEFHQASLREAIYRKIEKLPIATLEEIIKELSLKFQERRPLSTYEKGLVTIGKTGEKRKATIIASYVDDMIVDNDVEKSNSKVMTFLVELLFANEQKLVDLPQNTEKLSTPKAKKQSQFDLNKEIEVLIDTKDKEGSSFNEEERNYIRQYTGSGGLLKEGATGRGALYEYYTPELVVNKMWDMAKHFGYKSGAILEPSVGTGNFLKVLPKNVKIDGYETNHYSARIAKILYPHVNIHEKAFETLFFAGNIHLKDKFENPGYSLVIGNPPYGDFTGKYAGMGEKQYTGATEYDQYFILRGLDVLKKGGLLVFLIPSSFMSNKSKFNKVKESIALKADFIDSYRLPTGIFQTTDIGTDIIVLQKK